MADIVRSRASFATTRERFAVASLSLCLLMASLGSSIANAALPNLSKALGASFESVQWIVLSYLLSVTVLVVSIGRLSDRVGRKRLLIFGLLLYSLASALCAFAPMLLGLVVARALQGVGAAVLMAVPLAMVGEIVPSHRTGTVMGILGATSAIGTALGPSLGSILSASMGWRSIFAALVPVGLLAAAIGKAYLPADPPIRASNGKGFDVKGTILLGSGLAAYCLSLTVGRSLGGSSILLTLLAVAMIALFFALQKRSNSALLPLDLLKNPAVSRGMLTSLLVSTVLMSTLVVGPFYLSSALQLDAYQVGLILTTGPAVVAVLGVPLGRMADRFGASRLAAWGLTAVAVGCLLLAVFPLASGVAGYVAPIVVIGAGYAAFQTSNNSAVMTAVETERRGVLAGLLNLSRNLGLVTGASLMGAIFAAASGTPSVETAARQQVGEGFRFTFAVATVLALIAFAALHRDGARYEVAREVCLGR